MELTRRQSLGLAAAAVAGTTIASTTTAQAGTDRWVRETLRRMSLEQKVGQLFVCYAYGPAADTADPRNTSLYGVATPAEVVRKYHLGGVIYFAWTDSVKDPQQIARLSNGLQSASLADSGIPLQISTDQEYGVVFRVGPPATEFPGAMTLGATRSAQYARLAAGIGGRELKAVGISTDFAPVADVNVNPLNPVIGVRSFSRPRSTSAAGACTCTARTWTTGPTRRSGRSRSMTRRRSWPGTRARTCRSWSATSTPIRPPRSRPGSGPG